MTRIVVDKSTDHNINVKENVFFSEPELEKGIAWHIDVSSVVWTLVDNGKLANQIARLIAIVVKVILNKRYLLQWILFC